MDSWIDAALVIMRLRVSVFSLFLVAGTCAVPKDGYGDPQLGCGDTVIAQEGSDAMLSVFFDLGDRPTLGHVLQIRKPRRVGNAQRWITCTWMTNDEYNHDNTCNERARISKILGRTYQLRKTISSVRKEDTGNYSVSLRVSTDQNEIIKTCDLELRVVEASPTTIGGPEIHSFQQSAMESGSGKEESQSNVLLMVIVGVVPAIVVELLVGLGAHCF